LYDKFVKAPYRRYITTVVRKIQQNEQNVTKDAQKE